MNTRLVPLALAWALVAGSPLAFAADIQTQNISFARGASSATIKGSIAGDRTIDYKLRAKAGQTMNVALKTSNSANYFNVLPPGSNDVAVFVGSTNGNEWTGTLQADGEYTVRVYLMRSAARRNEKASYTLTVGITGGAAGAARSTDAKVAGTPYHSTGQVPCATAAGQPTGSCPFGVVREGGGTGTVTVTKPDGRSRSIFFEKGKATGYDMSQADRGEFSASKQGDLNVIRIGPERYEIPDAVIFGG
ncbi:MAG: hypothetical protein ACREVR_18185 [Burkholderiales bacterium]